MKRFHSFYTLTLVITLISFVHPAYGQQASGYGENIGIKWSKHPNLQKDMPDGLWGDEMYFVSMIVKRGSQVIGEMSAYPPDHNGKMGHYMFKGSISKSTVMPTDVIEIKAKNDVLDECRPEVIKLRPEPFEVNDFLWRKYPWLIIAGNNEDPAEKGRQEAEETTQYFLRYFDLPPVKPLVVFIGGAMDSVYLNMSKVHDQYEKTSPPNSYLPFDQDILYFFYPEGDQIKAEMAILEKVILQPKTPITIIGHSYGGDTACRIARNLSEHGLNINLLVTLDPVSNRGRFTSALAKPGDSTRWINIYVDKGVISTTGGYWGNQENAYSIFVPDTELYDASKMFSLIKSKVQDFDVCTRRQKNVEGNLLKLRAYYIELEERSRSSAPKSSDRIH